MTHPLMPRLHWLRQVGNEFMAVTTEFHPWLKALELDDYREVYSLYKSVETCSPVGIFDVRPATGTNRWLVRAPHLSEELLLASIEAQQAFLLQIKHDYCAPDLDLESWYSFKQSTEKKD